MCINAAGKLVRAAIDSVRLSVTIISSIAYSVEKAGLNLWAAPMIWKPARGFSLCPDR